MSMSFTCTMQPIPIFVGFPFDRHFPYFAFYCTFIHPHITVVSIKRLFSPSLSSLWICNYNPKDNFATGALENRGDT